MQISPVTENTLAIRMAQGASSPFHHQHVISLLENAQISGRNVLDFGAGSGALLESFQKRGFSGVGVDALPRPKDLNSKLNWLVADLNDELPSEMDATFDCITAIEVIEHLENPRHCLRTLFKKLRPGGILILSSPNPVSYRSLLSLIFRDNFVDFLDSSYPAHITPVLPMDITRMLSEISASEIDVSFSDRGNVPALTFTTWQKLSFGLLKGKRFSDHWFAVARKPLR